MDTNIFEFTEVNPPTYGYGEKENNTDGCLAIAKIGKQFKTTKTELEIRTSSQIVVDINNMSFILDEQYPWIKVICCEDADGEISVEVDEIDILNEDGSVQVKSLEELKIVSLNWYFNNVEIVAKDV